MHTVYSPEESLQIELPRFASTSKLELREQDTQAFSVIEQGDVSRIKSLVIHQDGYYHYEHIDSHLSVIIPEIIGTLTAVETISISACVEGLPTQLSRLTNLRLLDLSGCYNLLSIPECVQEMTNLKIQIGDVVSEASAVVFIDIPRTGITTSILSVISSSKSKNIEQLIIGQSRRQNPEPERFELPDRIQELKELKTLSAQGNLSCILDWKSSSSYFIQPEFMLYY